MTLVIYYDQIRDLATESLVAYRDNLSQIYSSNNYLSEMEKIIYKKLGVGCQIAVTSRFYIFTFDNESDQLVFQLKYVL